MTEIREEAIILKISAILEVHCAKIVSLIKKELNVKNQNCSRLSDSFLLLK